MNEIHFYLGMTLGIYTMQALNFFLNRENDRPFRLAFSILSAYYAATVLINTVLYLHFGIYIPERIMLGIDFCSFPLFMLEIMCLVNQENNKESWRRRCRKLAWVSIPMPIYILYSIISGVDKPVYTLPDIIILLYPLYIFGTIVTKLRMFQQKLQKVELEEKKRDFKWAWYITAMLFVNYIMYMFYENLPSPVIYYIVAMVTNIIHGYFIHRQVPTYTGKIEEMILMEQEKALEELKDVTESMKKRARMDTAILEYKAKYPGFENRLRALTETKLTDRDIYLCILIHEGKSTQSMAEELAISPSSAEIARHRLRTKLNLGKGENLKAALQVIEILGGG